MGTSAVPRQALQRTYTGNIALVIPARRPGDALIRLISEVSSCFRTIIIVLDGHFHDNATLVDQIREYPTVVILHHPVSLGKGRALKAGLDFVINVHPSVTGVVTADADGQHTSVDVIRMADALEESTNSMVIGVRQFGRNVPLRSRLGNITTKYLFAFLTARRLSDTQCGLRGIPIGFIPELLNLAGDRYEYETIVLAHACSSARDLRELAIQTVYLNNNRSSYFNPIGDSMRIYVALVRYCASSVISAVIDFIALGIAASMTGNVLAGLLIGRVNSLLNVAVTRFSQGSTCNKCARCPGRQ